MHTLVRKHRKYTNELKIRHRHLSRLELSCDDRDIERWELARQDMEEKRVKDPYYADVFWETACAPSSKITVFHEAQPVLMTLLKAPGKGATEVRLLEDDDNGLVNAIVASLKLEEDG